MPTPFDADWAVRHVFGSTPVRSASPPSVVDNAPSRREPSSGPHRPCRGGRKATPYPFRNAKRSTSPDSLLGLAPESPRSDVAVAGSPAVFGEAPVGTGAEADNGAGIPALRSLLLVRAFRQKWAGYGLVTAGEYWPEVHDGLRRMLRDMEHSQPHYHPDAPPPSGLLVHEFLHDAQLLQDLYKSFTVTPFLLRESSNERDALGLVLSYTRGLISNGYFLDEGQGCLSRDVRGPLDQPIDKLRTREVIEPLENAMHVLENTIKIVREAATHSTRYE